MQIKKIMETSGAEHVRVAILRFSFLEERSGERRMKLMAKTINEYIDSGMKTLGRPNSKSKARGTFSQN